MSRSAICSVTSRQVLDRLREEFERAGHGSMRRVSSELGLKPDYLSWAISRGSMEVGVFFAAIERLGVAPRVFSTRKQTRQGLEATLPETKTVAKALAEKVGSDS